MIHVGGAEVRGEVAALTGEDAAAQLPASRTFGEKSAQFIEPQVELLAADRDSMSP